MRDATNRTVPRVLRLGGLSLTLALAAVWFVFLRPTFMGGSTAYILVSGISMEPTLYTGDLAILRKQDAYAVGDVIAFQVEGGVVIHRIVGGDAKSGYVPRGDNRDSDDMWRPTPNNIGGRMWFHVPKVGLAIAVLRQKQNLPVFAAFAGAFLVLAGGGKRKARAP